MSGKTNFKKKPTLPPYTKTLSILPSIYLSIYLSISHSNGFFIELIYMTR